MVDVDTEFSMAIHVSYQDNKKLCDMKSVPTVIGFKSLVSITVQIFTSSQVQ